MPHFEEKSGVTPELPPGHRAPLMAILGDGPTGTDPEHAKRNRGEALCLMVERLGYTNLQAWRMVFPSSRATDAAAKVLAIRARQKHRREFPMGIIDALAKHGITIERIVGVLERSLDAKVRRWDNEKGRLVETDLDDYTQQRQAARSILKDVVPLDQKSRQELALGRAEAQKMQLNTGMKFDTIQEWQEYMKGRDAEILESRAKAARDMRLIAQGRQIIQEQGQAAAEKMRKAAQDAGMTGDEPDEEADAAAAKIRELGADL